MQSSSGPADSDGLRLSAFSAPGFSVDNDAAGQVVRSRQEGNIPEADN